MAFITDSLVHTSLNKMVWWSANTDTFSKPNSPFLLMQMPLEYWDDAFSTAVYLINRLPISVLNGRIPMFLLTNKMPDPSSLKSFGCLCFPYLRPYNNYKLAFRSTPCTFIGYSDKHKGYKCISSTGRLYISRHVRFNESSFPFKTHNTGSSVSSKSTSTNL